MSIDHLIDPLTASARATIASDYWTYPAAALRCAHKEPEFVADRNPVRPEAPGDGSGRLRFLDNGAKARVRQAIALDRTLMVLTRAASVGAACRPVGGGGRTPSVRSGPEKGRLLRPGQRLATVPSSRKIAAGPRVVETGREAAS